MRRLRWLLGCVLLLFLGLVVCSGVSWFFFPPLTFDAAAWRAANQPDGAELVRQRMLADLLKRPLVGMTKDEVRDLLGEPTMNRDGQDWHFDYAYRVGPQIPLLPINVESEYLGLKFENGRVAAAWVFID